MQSAYHTYTLTKEEAAKISLSKYYLKFCNNRDFKKYGFLKIKMPKHLYQENAIKEIQDFLNHYNLRNKSTFTCLYQELTELTPLVSKYESTSYDMDMTKFLENNTEKTGYLFLPGMRAPKDFSSDEVW